MKRQHAILIIGLCLLWLGLFYSYAPVASYPLLSYDDPAYLTANPLAQQSLTSLSFWKNLSDTAVVNLWHPLTVLSHQLPLRLTSDWGVHHLLNVVGHGFVATIWALLLYRATGNQLAAIASALFFAWHPATVESVAWLSGRKDILTALFISGMAFCHLHWVQHQKRWAYHLSLVLGCAAMLSKPIAFVAPILLVALDLWPLKRFPFNRASLSEKLIWLIPSTLTVLLTLKFQLEGSQAVLDSRTLLERSASALWSLKQSAHIILWPSKLYHGYRDPTSINLGQLALITGALLGLFTSTFFLRKKAPYLVPALLFALITVGPTLGFVRAGNQLSADRYQYLPILGLSLIIAGLLKNSPFRFSVFLVLIAFPFLFLQGKMVRHWESLETLFSHTLEQDPTNPTALANLAQIAEQSGDREKARDLLKKAIASQPGNTGVHLLLANISFQEQKWSEACENYLIAAKTRRNDPDIHEFIARCYLQLEAPAKALLHFEKAKNLTSSSEQTQRMEQQIQHLKGG